jgi:electron transport complex protein RnfG
MRAEQEMGKIIPQADNFIEIKNTANIPRTISGIFKAAQNENTLGYIFMISIPGYGGDIKIVCGIDKNGKIIKTQVLSHTETKGMTDPVFSDPHQSQYTGKDKNLLDIIAVTGATVSSTAYKNGIKDAFLAFDIVSVLNKGAAHE